MLVGQAKPVDFDSGFAVDGFGGVNAPNPTRLSDKVNSSVFPKDTPRFMNLKTGGNFPTIDAPDPKGAQPLNAQAVEGNAKRSYGIVFGFILLSILTSLFISGK